MNRDRIYRMAWVLAAAIPLVSASVAQAGALYYNCASTNNGWDDGITADWSTTSLGAYNQPWSSGSDAYFEGTAGSVTVSNTISSVNSITFNQTSYVLNGGSITLTGSGGNVTTNSTYADTINSTLAGSVGLTKLGAGTLTLAGNNTFTGGTTLTAGTLNINSATALGNGTFTITGSTLSMNNTSGAALNLTTNNPQSWNVNQIIVGPSGNNGNNNNSLSMGTGAITLSPPSSVTNVTVNSTTTSPGIINLALQNTLTIAGNIGEATPGMALRKSGNGTLVLSGNNTFTGGVQVAGGMLAINSSTALGTGPLSSATNPGFANTSGNSVTVTTGNSFAWGGGPLYFDGPNNLNLGTGPVTMTVAGRAIIESGTIFEMDGSITNGSGGSGIELIASISGGGGTWVLGGNRTYTGSTAIDSGSYAGTLVLSGASPSYSGTYTLSGGTLCVNNNQALGTSLMKFNGTVLDNTSGGLITVTTGNNWELASGKNLTFLGSNPLDLGAGNVTLDSSQTITVNASTLTVDGAISGASYGLTKAGAGTLTFTGNNTYSGGTTISAGTLQIGSGGATGTLGVGAVINNAALVFNLTGTPSFSNAIQGTGTVTQNGAGTVTLFGVNTYSGMTTVNAGTLAYGVENVIPGAVTVNGGEFALGTHSGTVTGVTLTGGLISSSGGTLTSTSDFNVQNGSITANLAGAVGLTKTTSGTVVLGSLSGYTPSGSLNYTGMTTINGGTLEAIGSGGLGLLSSAGLNIEHGKAVLDYTGTGYTPATLDPIANTLMQSAHANGWVIDGTHPVGSTTAATDPLIHALGWTDTVVDGRTVLTVMYTLLGDTDLSGTVTGADLNTVLSNYNKTGMYWAQGDFNYDGTVNGSDLNMVLSNYNQSVSVGAAVPEPGTLGMLALGAIGVLAWKGWRKRK